MYGAGADIATARKPRAEPHKAFGDCCGHRSLFQGFDPVDFDKMRWTRTSLRIESAR